MEEKNNSDRNSLSKGLSAASTLKSAAKTGKAVSSMAKGAAGGPFGMIAPGYGKTENWLRKY